MSWILFFCFCHLMMTFRASCSITTDWMSSLLHTLSSAPSIDGTWATNKQTSTPPEKPDDVITSGLHRHSCNSLVSFVAASDSHLFADDVRREALFGDYPQCPGARVLVCGLHHQGAKCCQYVCSGRLCRNNKGRRSRSDDT